MTLDGSASLEARFRDFVEELDAIFWEADAETWRFTFVSGRAEAMLGYPIAAWLADGGFWASIIHPEDRERALSFCASMSGQASVYEFDYRAIAADGRIVWLHDMVRVVRDAAGRVRLLRGVMVDVTEKKKVEEELRYRKTVLECQSEASLDGILIVSPEGRIVSFNQRFVALWRIPADVAARGSDEEALTAVQGMLVNPQEFLARVQYMYEHPEESSRDELLLKDGRVVDRYGAPVRAPDGTLYGRVWFFRDITEMRLQERRKDEFLAMLGHELRNPLAPILNALNVMKRRDGDPAAVDRARDVVERQVKQLTRLVDDLLDVSRITRGKIELRKETLELANVLHRAVETALPLVEAKRHRVVVRLPEGAVHVRADAARLEQVFLNLLNNAVKYTEAGGRISLTAEREGDEVVVRVRDTGIGMPADFVPRAFDLFAQASRSIDRSEGGLGLGLTLVRRLVEMHDGSVAASSDGPGKGTEMVVRLPIADAPARPRQEGVAPVSAGPGASRRVLVVDDNIDAAQTLAEYLVDCGHAVHVAHDGRAAIEAAVAHRPEIVFLDIGLPGMDGYEVAARLRANPALADVQLIAVSGYGQDEDRRRSFAAGFTHHLVKPVEPDLLASMLRV